MNKLNGTIVAIQRSGGIVLADVDVEGYLFSAILVDTGDPDNWLKVANPVVLAFKETEVSLAKGLSGLISLRNRIQCRVKSIERGELLCKVNLDFKGWGIASVITSRSILMLDLAEGDLVETLIKANEMVLIQVKPNGN